MNSDTVVSYLPKIYEEVAEIQSICSAEQELFDVMLEETQAIRANQFIQLCDINRIEDYERIFSIMANPSTETDSFRRARVFNRLATKTPFTIQYLRDKLNEIIGEGKYLLSIDYATYTLTIESLAQDQAWSQEIYVTVNRLKPANIVFVNKPLSYYEIRLSEVINYNTTVYNYRLGSTWVLGALPFWGFIEKGVIKMAGVPSLSTQLMTDVAAFTATDIVSVLINDTLEITTFLTKANVAGVVTLEYEVGFGDVAAIESIKIRNSSDQVLATSSVYVPVLEDIVMKHVITVVEGV